MTEEQDPTPDLIADLSDDDSPVRRRWRGPLAILIVAIILVVVGRIAEAQGLFDLHRVTAWLEPVSRVWWSPIAIVALFVIFNIFGLPGSVLTMAAGVVWGFAPGGAVALIGSTVGTALPYLLAKRHAPWAEHHMRQRAARLHARLQRDSFTTMLMLRLVPGVPYAITNYAAGFAGVRPLHYFAATAIGTVPGVFIYAWLAASIFRGDLSLSQALMRVAFAGMMLATIVIVTRIVAARLRRMGRDV